MCLRNLVVLTVAASIFTAAGRFGSEIRVWSGGAVAPVMNVLVPQFEQQTGHKVQFRIMTVLNQLPQRLAAGERGEMAITALPDIDRFIKDGYLRASSRAILGSVGIALVMREGAP
jgi:molybdate transport system substrate-binding protein